MSDVHSAVHDRLKLHPELTDPGITTELLKHAEGPERDAYAMSALRLGLLEFHHGCGAVDAQAVRDAADVDLGERARHG